MFSSKMDRYLSKNFLTSFVIILTILVGIVFVFEFGEMLRRAAKNDMAGFDIALKMALLKLPWTSEIILPFAVLFGAIHTCWKLNRTHELVVIRAAGLSVWQFLSPIIGAAVIIGLLSTGFMNPLASVMLSKFRQMEIVHFNKKSNLFSVSQTGIWLRQPLEEGYALIHAATLDQSKWKMSDVIVHSFDDMDGLLQRIDSPRAYLKTGGWEIHQARISRRDNNFIKDVVVIPTELTPVKIEESFADPDTISFWKIPQYTKIMEETGLVATQLKIHFQSLLARPLLFAAMVLLAATFSLRPPRFRQTGIMIALGAVAGFLIFFMESILGAFGISQKIPVVLAAWTPAMVGCLFGITALLHMEDG